MKTMEVRVSALRYGDIFSETRVVCLRHEPEDYPKEVFIVRDDGEEWFCNRSKVVGVLRDDRSNWQRNDIQFARMLAEINAIGLTEDQYKAIADSMDLTRLEIDEILIRADVEFDLIKQTL